MPPGPPSQPLCLTSVLGYGYCLVSLCDTAVLSFVIDCKLARTKSCVVQTVVWLFYSSLHAAILVYCWIVCYTINHVHKYYTFPSYFSINTCSAGDNYAHVQTVDTRFFFSPTKSLGTRLWKIKWSLDLPLLDFHWSKFLIPVRPKFMEGLISHPHEFSTIEFILIHFG